MKYAEYEKIVKQMMIKIIINNQLNKLELEILDEIIEQNLETTQNVYEEYDEDVFYTDEEIINKKNYINTYKEKKINALIN